jgi:hypothetical protein
MVDILDGLAQKWVIQAEFVSMAHNQALGRHIFTYSSTLQQEEDSFHSEWGTSKHGSSQFQVVNCESLQRSDHAYGLYRKHIVLNMSTSVQYYFKAQSSYQHSS